VAGPRHRPRPAGGDPPRHLAQRLDHGRRLALGLGRLSAARFSFLLSIPAILGASAKESLDLYQHGAGAAIDPTAFAVGFVVSFLVGTLTLRVLVALLVRVGLLPFVPYLIGLGLAVLAGSTSASKLPVTAGQRRCRRTMRTLRLHCTGVSPLSDRDHHLDARPAQHVDDDHRLGLLRPLREDHQQREGGSSRPLRSPPGCRRSS
jgi:hypothetical protein